MARTEEDIIRSTVYLSGSLHKALRIKAAESRRSMSDLINEAVKISLAEDLEDIAAFEERGKEKDILFEDVLKDLKLRGKI